MFQIPPGIQGFARKQRNVTTHPAKVDGIVKLKLIAYHLSSGELLKRQRCVRMDILNMREEK